MKMTGLYRFALFVLTPIFKILYGYKIIGRENLPKTGAVLICSNHTGYKDCIFMGLANKRQVWFMAKKELFQKKFFGKLISKLGAFPVERSGGISAIKRGIYILKKDGAVGIFIEGTRSKTGELLKPKPGVTLLAYETKAAIVPMAIIGENGKPPKLFNRAVINIGKPIAFEELEMTEISGTEMRRASRKIIERISELRMQAITRK